MAHKHRIIPGYEGGEYREQNVVKLTPTQHAMWHYAEWLRKEDYRDFCAYKMLLGDVKNPEFRSARGRAFGHIGGKIGGHRTHELHPTQGSDNNKKQRENLAKLGKTIAEKNWVVTDPKGCEFIITNLAKFCRENDLSNSKMCCVAKGHNKTHKGWKVRRA